MPERGRLGPVQVLALMLTVITIWGHLVVVRVTIEQAGRDAWLAGVAGGLAGLLIVAVITFWCVLWPDRNLFTVLQGGLGPLSPLVTAAYLAYFWLNASLSGQLFGSAFSIIMPETPTLAIVGLLLFLSTYALATGLEPMARTVGILLTVVVVIAWVMLVPATLKDQDYGMLLPVMLNGPAPVLRGALSILTWLCDLGLLLMLTPMVHKWRRPWLTNLAILVAAILMIVGPLIGPVAVFGPEEAARMTLPTFSQIRYVRVATYLENVDTIAILFWTVGLFSRMTLFHYLMVLGTAQVFGLKEYKSLLVPTAVLIGLGLPLVNSSPVETDVFLKYSYPVLNLFFGLGVPGICLLVGTAVRAIRRNRMG